MCHFRVSQLSIMNRELDQTVRHQSLVRVIMIKYGSGFYAVEVSHTTIDSFESGHKD
jgi:hypothetical protein